MSKKGKSKKVLQDSESEDGEDGGTPMQNDALGGDVESGEEKENILVQKNKKSRRIRQLLLDSDDSDTGDHLQIENLETNRKTVLPEKDLEGESPLKSGKKYRKHENNCEEETTKKAVVRSRRKEKERERRIASIKQLKKEKKPRAEVFVFGRNSHMLSPLS